MTGPAERKAIGIEDRINFIPLWIEARVGDKKLGTATGTVWKRGDQYLLLTALHVITGTEPTSGQFVYEGGQCPDIIEIHARRRGFLSEHLPISCELRSGGRTLWHEHPVHRLTDIAALPFTPPAGVILYPINEIRETTMIPAVSEPVFVVGFPVGISAGGRLPIWKRGSIATDPAVPINGRPAVLVDSATRQGMSGAPVIYRNYGWHRSNPERLLQSDYQGFGDRFFGVWSGRFKPVDEFDAQLGVCVPVAIIRELVDSIPEST